MTPLIDALPPRHVRRTADLSRLLVSGVVLVVTVLPAVAAHASARRMQQGLLDAPTALPPGLRDGVVGAVQVVAIVAPVVAFGVLTARRRGDAILRIVPAAALGALLSWSVTQLALTPSRPDLWPRVLVGRGALLHAGWPSEAYLAACAAAVVAAGPWLEARLRRT
ncbi:hypothetical protein [Streptomyces sp. NPDC096012]|uniref:hypothetical protein n=1 Tax=Streptomyces sp. NPDC096012 TaxID=3155684 RepID=UPI00336A9117